MWDIIKGVCFVDGKRLYIASMVTILIYDLFVFSNVTPPFEATCFSY